MLLLSTRQQISHQSAFQADPNRCFQRHTLARIRLLSLYIEYYVVEGRGDFALVARVLLGG